LPKISWKSTATAAAGPTLPTFAICGRPNVGKSTLFNRIVGRRRAIVGDEPGITRDRLYAVGEWRGRHFRLVDTGGIVPEDKDFIPAEIFRQARVALDESAAIILVVDAQTELAAPDLELARLLRRTGKPLFLAVNKIDDAKHEGLLEDFRRLGITDLYPVSAEHGRGVDDLLDAILETLKLEAAEPSTAEDAESAEITGEEEALATSPREIRVAIIGKPNVGKSTLLNRLIGADRAIVSPIPGTTRDAVDEIVERDGQVFRFVDTAGIRRKGKTKLMAEKLSVVMARKHLEAADIALLVIDAQEGVNALDANIAGYAHESGRSVIIVVNKWDLVAGRPLPQKHHRPGESRAMDPALYEITVRDALKFLAYAPVLFVSASTGRNVDKVFNEVVHVAAERRKRVSTGEMNRFLSKIDFERASVPLRSRVRILYMTQAGVAPPTFVLFTDRKVKLHFSYQRYIENQIRRAFGFVGTPIWIKNKARG
jgi:GTP-binding protein